LDVQNNGTLTMNPLLAIPVKARPLIFPVKVKISHAGDRSVQPNMALHRDAFSALAHLREGAHELIVSNM
jgi:hypothetical protein